MLMVAVSVMTDASLSQSIFSSASILSILFILHLFGTLADDLYAFVDPNFTFLDLH